MTATSVGVSKEHITKTPGVCGGKACIAGHRIRVMDIVIWHNKWGQCPDEIVHSFPSITVADVHAALTYYYDHQEEVDADFAKSKACDEHGRLQQSKLKDYMNEVRELLRG